MALRDIFKFREAPETETSKPFLEHLEDLRWTIVKMALTLIVAMIVCFAFRSTLVRIIQALYESAERGKVIPLPRTGVARRPSGRQRIVKPPVRKPSLVKASSASKD